MPPQPLRLDELPSLDELDAELSRRSFAEFVRVAWPEVDPAPLVWGWHVGAVCEHLQAVTEGQIQRLLINIPPGHAKSMLVSVLWPAWVWTRQPAWQVMTASYGADLAIRDAVKCRSLLDSHWYIRHFRKGWTLSTDQNVKSFYVNTERGFRVALSVGGKATGWRGDSLIIDDPLNASDSYSKLKRDEVIRWKTETMSSRFNDLQKATEVVIMQRLHEEDLSGYLLANGGWEHLCLPSEYEPERRRRTAIGWEDPRKDPGELLFREKFPREVLNRAKTSEGMGETAYAGQHQQRPVPAEGGIFKTQWWRFWRFDFEEEIPELRERTVVIPTRELWHQWFQEVILSGDLAFKDTSQSDKVALGAWGRRGPHKYLLGLRWERMSYVRTKKEFAELVLDFCHLDRSLREGEAFDQLVADLLNPEKREAATRLIRPWYVAMLIEDKANGSAVIEEFRQTFPSVLAITPKESKEARAHTTTPQFEGGNVFIPLHMAKRQLFIDEHAGFPKGAHDDAVDMTTQALNWMRGRDVVTTDFLGAAAKPAEDGSFQRLRKQRL